MSLPVASFWCHPGPHQGRVGPDPECPSGLIYSFLHPVGQSHSLLRNGGVVYVSWKCQTTRLDQPFLLPERAAVRNAHLEDCVIENDSGAGEESVLPCC